MPISPHICIWFGALHAAVATERHSRWLVEADALQWTEDSDGEAAKGPRTCISAGK